MIDKIYTIPVETDENGDAYITLPDEIIKSYDLKENDPMTLELQQDGSIILTKK